MSDDMHARARQLIAAARVEGISSAEQAWLDGHLDGCANCAQVAAGTQRAIESLRWVAVNADPGMVRATRLLVRMRAQDLDEARSRGLLLWVSGVLTAVLGMATLPLLWDGFSWLGAQLHLPDAVWQVTLVFVWFLPTMLLAATLLREKSRWARPDSHATRARMR